MAVDLSRTHRNAVQDAVRRARQLDQQGHAAAAAAWEAAAAQTDAYAQAGRTAAERERRTQRAAAYRERAESLRSSRQETSKEPTDETPDEYRAAARQLIHRSKMTFDQIAGQKETIQQIRSLLALSQAAPAGGTPPGELENLLFSGPAGCGKTILAAAVSNGLDATFFSVKVPDLLSRYYGESPRLLKALFAEARSAEFSVVFIDETDALGRNRSESDSSADRKLLTSLLTELDGLNQKGQAANVMTIAATNRPWDLDEALLSRFGEHIFIDLPDTETRLALLDIELRQKGYQVAFAEHDWLRATGGYSGREVAALCRRMIRQMKIAANPDILEHAGRGRAALQNYQLRITPLTREQLTAAAAAIRPQTTPSTLQNFRDWHARQTTASPHALSPNQ